MDFLSQLIQGLTMKHQAPAPTKQPMSQQFQPHTPGLPAQDEPAGRGIFFGTVDKPYTRHQYGAGIDLIQGMLSQNIPQESNFQVYSDNLHGNGRTWLENQNTGARTYSLPNIPDQAIQPFNPMATATNPVIAQPQFRLPGQQKYPTIRL